MRYVIAVICFLVVVGAAYQQGYKDGNKEGVQEGCNMARKAMQKEAVSRGFAVFKHDRFREDKYGNPIQIFEWKESNKE